ncbi:MAG: hypothetical protein ACLVAT_07980 [Lachnospiraceae bacterium]
MEFSIFWVWKNSTWEKSWHGKQFYVALISIVSGVILGIALDKAMYLLILQVLGVEIRLGFYISGKAILTTVVLFLSIFLIIFLLNSVRQVHMANPIELLHAGNAGVEKNQKQSF